MFNRSPAPPGNPLGKLSQSILIPLAGDRSNLVRKAYLLPVGITLITSLVLFKVITNPQVFLYVIALYANAAFVYFIYRLTGRQRVWWLLPSVGVATGLALLTPLWLVVDVPFVLLGDSLSAIPLIGYLWSNFCIGLREELFKALPVLLLAFIVTRSHRPMVSKIGVFEPLDGILLGAASGAGFALVETVVQYVPHAIQQSQSLGLGYEVLLARLLSELGGHIAYSGYFGYFIGLSVQRRRSAQRLLLVGWLSSAGLHGSWDAIPESFWPLAAVVALVSYASLAAAILKGRQLSPTRAQNFATVTLAPAPAGAPAHPGEGEGVGSAAPLVVAPAASPQAGAPRTNGGSAGRGSAGAAAGPLVLTLGTARHVMVPGVRIEPQALGSAGAGRGKAPVAEVTTNPRDASILGLRNTSTLPWNVRLASGQTVVVESGKSVRLDVGMAIDFGGITAHVQPAP